MKTLQRKHHSSSKPKPKSSFFFQRKSENNSFFAPQKNKAPSSTDKNFFFNHSSRNSNGLPQRVKTKMESSFGQDFSSVKIHENSSKVTQINAKAYTEGENIHFASGQFNPHSKKGQELIGHELSHVVQQKEGRVSSSINYEGININDDVNLEKEADHQGSKAASGEKIKSRVSSKKNKTQNSINSGIIQGFFSKGMWRKTDDLTAALINTMPNHVLYAKSGKAAASNKKLKAVGSSIQLNETSKQKTFFGPANSKPRKKEKLNKIEIQHGGKTGDDVELYADCGKCNAEIVGSKKRHSISTSPNGKVKHVSGDPVVMKVEIMMEWLKEKLKTATTAEKNKINGMVLALTAIKDDITKLIAEKKAEKDAGKKKKIAIKIEAKAYKYSDVLWGFYNSLSAKEREKIDKQLGINKFANPTVGQGFTTVSSDYPGPKTWNFHWGGVIMESDSKKDKIVLENYSVNKPNEKNKKWDIQMYGTEKKGQTFHEQHKATNQHGKTPTTLAVEKD